MKMSKIDKSRNENICMLLKSVKGRKQKRLLLLDLFKTQIDSIYLCEIIHGFD